MRRVVNEYQVREALPVADKAVYGLYKASVVVVRIHIGIGHGECLGVYQA